MRTLLGTIAASGNDPLGRDVTVLSRGYDVLRIHAQKVNGDLARLEALLALNKGHTIFYNPIDVPGYVNTTDLGAKVKALVDHLKAVHAAHPALWLQPINEWYCGGSTPNSVPTPLADSVDYALRLIRRALPRAFIIGPDAQGWTWGMDQGFWQRFKDLGTHKLVDVISWHDAQTPDGVTWVNHGAPVKWNGGYLPTLAQRQEEYRDLFGTQPFAVTELVYGDEADARLVAQTLRAAGGFLACPNYTEYWNDPNHPELDHYYGLEADGKTLKPATRAFIEALRK
jgi:hypothetical protein